MESGGAHNKNANQLDTQADAAVVGFLDILIRRLHHELVLRSVFTGLAGGMVAAAVALVLGESGWWGVPGFLAGFPLGGGLRLVRGVSAREAAEEAEARFPMQTRHQHLLSTLAGLDGREPSARREDAGGGEVQAALLRLGGSVVAGLEPRRLLPLKWQREAGAMGGAALLLVLALMGGDGGEILPGGAAESGEQPLTSRAVAPAGAGSKGDPSLHMMARTVPPGYTGLPPVEVDNPESLRLLPGSRLKLWALSGPVTPAASLITADGEEALQVHEAPDGWRVDWVMGVEPAALLLHAVDPSEAGERPLRLLPISPLQDPAPIVTLEAPAQDLVLATGSGTLRVEARALDEFGVDSMALVWTRTRGGGESFAFQEGRLEGLRVIRPGPGELRASVDVDLATLDLRPGDLLHLRAEAVDGNSVTGPGRGASPVRILRVAIEGDQEEVNTLIGFPLEAEREPVLSQRMIILLTEDLVDRAPGLPPDQVRREAQGIAREQARLRAEVGEQVFSRATGAMRDPGSHLGDDAGHGHDADLPSWVRGEAGGEAAEAEAQDHEEADGQHEAEEFDFESLRGFTDDLGGAVAIMDVDEGGHEHDGDPILSVNEELLDAFNSMWEAERELLQTRMTPSLPFQYQALEQLQALRTAARVFPRGDVTAPPVDVASTRGTGPRVDVDPAPRVAGVAVEGVQAREGELEAMVRRLPALGVAQGGRELAFLAARLLPLGDAGAQASVHLSRAVARLRDGSVEEAQREVEVARGLLAPRVTGGAALPTPLPRSLAEAGLLAPGRSGAVESGAGGDSRAASESANPARPFVFATVRYRSGNWDSAPLVPTNLHHTVARYTDIPVTPEGAVVDLAAPDLHRYPFVFLTGHLPVRFTPEESENLKRYIDNGGFLFIDDHNHDIDGAFHRTVLEEMSRLFGADALQPLPTDHPLYHTFFRFPDGPPTTSHELSGWGDGLIHSELFGIQVDGRLAVLYSNKDYASEWNYHAVNKRFLALDNTRLGMNILLYALTR
ncbi:MAG: DUF4159 domain-containing protein [Gemmatimonadota bacterium]